jgi:hypothetical protein
MINSYFRTLPIIMFVINHTNLIIQSVHCAGLLGVLNILSADTGVSRQTEGHLFGDHMSSKSVCVTPSNVI